MKDGRGFVVLRMGAGGERTPGSATLKFEQRRWRLQVQAMRDGGENVACTVSALTRGSAGSQNWATLEKCGMGDGG